MGRLGLVVALWLAACTGRDAGPTTKAAVHAPAPALQGKSVDGEYLQLSDFAGQVVLINVWATWCKPCKQELPELGRLHAKFAKQGFSVLGVTVDKVGALGLVKQFIAEHDLRYPMLFDPDGHSVGAYEIRGYPTTFVIGRDGTIRWRRDGIIEVNDGELDKQLQLALDEPAPK